ncbi:hypothetical protein K438DRAFT_1808082 [Mycena galopus ATCC 62051]|nr:hypothetical protein K438DRAFT_1808082 [Mycena galopus ATCC 62051]
MAPALIPTNMTAEEMVPDDQNPDHDPHYWCLPPVRDESSGRQSEGYPMYLVTQGRSVGVWHNWTVVNAVVSGHSGGAQRGHHTMASCIAEWQQHCVLGVHPHPPAPSHTGTASVTTRLTPRPALQHANPRPATISGPPRARARAVEPEL